ncbi:DUF1194 domain-containing protein [Mesorhizobium microcysteis]|uniref:DUF1194 domain-containing protein n=1 Tax=Neoaquamicrobium microcysteis TaxID=2682781 RepID=A0A5D4H096_9HYPH|nr:DUF1194 domain-containing protein [Mesorhizobium microcysteis]
MSRAPQPRLALQAALVLAMAGAVPTAATAEVVDVELILAVDVSLSMSPGELAIQRDGYAAALTHEQVIRAIQDGVHGRIALAYVEWAGATVQHIVVPWTIITNLQEAEAVAEQLTLHPPNSARRTSISGALAFAGDMFAESPHRGLKRVVDISGDGPNNQGGLVSPARDALVEQGITINGLPLMTSGGFSSVYDLANLDLYYQHCVIGGPGAFMIPVNDWTQFPEAVRRKLVLELAGGPQPQDLRQGMPVHLAQARDDADCEIGEKMWRDRSWMWDNR